MPRVKLFDQEKALQKAMEVFWEKGYNGTSLTDLTKALGIGKGSFYDTFTSKRNLFEMSLGLYRKNSIEALKLKLNTEKDVKKGVRHFLVSNLAVMIEDKQNKGCFLSNTCGEVNADDETTAKGLHTHYSQMKSIVATYLENAEVMTKETVKQVADIIITFFIGITQESKLRKDKKDMEESIDQLLQVLF